MTSASYFSSSTYQWWKFLRKFFTDCFSPTVTDEKSFVLYLNPKPSNIKCFSIGELLVAFFDYYNNEFDFTRDAGSVRKGTRVPLSECHEFARQNQVFGLLLSFVLLNCGLSFTLIIRKFRNETPTVYTNLNSANVYEIILCIYVNLASKFILINNWFITNIKFTYASKS